MNSATKQRIYGVLSLACGLAAVAFILIAILLSSRPEKWSLLGLSIVAGVLYWLRERNKPRKPEISS